MNENYAVATVVGRTPPVSSHLGDRAIVHADGRMEGFIGGACSRDIIRRQAVAAIRAGEPRLVRIRPDANAANDDGEIVTVPMTCVSEGAVDIFIEPHVPRRQFLIAGFTPVANALAQIAPALDYHVVRFVEEHELGDVRPSGETHILPVDALRAYVDTLDAPLCARSAAVVATQGHYDETALASLLQAELGYTGLLAGRKRAAAVIGALNAQGFTETHLARIHTPAGLDIGARKPAEVAISIFAEIVAAFAGGAATSETAAAPHRQPALAVDPVCGMEVEIAGARHQSAYNDSTYYFCCAHCRASFESDPAQFLTAGASP